MNTKSQDGQKDVRKILDKFHSCLNSESLLPAQTYVPSNVGFSPVIIINQIVALMISKNYERIPFMVKLAYRDFSNFNGHPVYSKYREIAFDYLCQVTYFLKTYSEVDTEFIDSSIPKDILNAGKKNAPNFNAQTQKFENT
jgi:hypothetical protein